jgi:hypothetical protein
MYIRLAMDSMTITMMKTDVMVENTLDMPHFSSFSEAGAISMARKIENINRIRIFLPKYRITVKRTVNRRILVILGKEAGFSIINGFYSVFS